NLLEPREESRTGVAARDALHLVDGKEFLRLRSIREEFVAAVVVPRDDQHIAADAGAASRSEPVGATAPDQCDERILVRRKGSPKRFLLVGRVDRDRTDSLLLAAGLQVPRGAKQRREQE